VQIRERQACVNLHFRVSVTSVISSFWRQPWRQRWTASISRVPSVCPCGFQHLDHAVQAEESLFVVHRFGDAIAEDDQLIAGRQRDFATDVRVRIRHADWRTRHGSRRDFFHLTRRVTNQERRQVAGVDGLGHVRGEIEYKRRHRNEAIRGDRTSDSSVEHLNRLGEIGFLLRQTRASTPNLAMSNAAEIPFPATSPSRIAKRFPGRAMKS
jgi:hypothetical protein